MNYKNGWEDTGRTLDTAGKGEGQTKSAEGMRPRKKGKEQTQDSSTESTHGA